MYKKYIFFSILENIPQIPLSEQYCILFAVHRNVVSASKCIKLFAIIWVRTALLPPLVLVSAPAVLIKHWKFGCWWITEPIHLAAKSCSLDGIEQAGYLTSCARSHMGLVTQMDMPELDYVTDHSPLNWPASSQSTSLSIHLTCTS